MKAPTLTDAKPWRLIRHRNGKPNLIGYARVSTREQTLDAQLTRLADAGCSRVFAEKISGAAGARPGWEAAISDLRKGDTLVVLRVDRMGRRLTELVRSLDEIGDLGAHVRSLEEAIDTSQKGGRFAFNLIATLAEKVRDDISQNTAAGLAEVKKRGTRLGRPLKLQPAKIAQLAMLHAQGHSLREIAAATGVGRTTVMRGLQIAEQKKGNARQLRLTGTEAAR
jgi:DNA invertase Pin-like site-specific DNA recombinase